MTCDVLAILIAAVKSERVFSAERALINYRRNRLKEETIENVLVSKSWINKILKKKIWSDDHDFDDHEISEKRKKQNQKIEDDEKNIDMHEIKYISSDEDEENDEHEDYNSADEGNVLHSEYIRRRNLRSNYNNYQKKTQDKASNKKEKDIFN